MCTLVIRLSSALLTLVLSGCSAVNLLFDDSQVFVKQRDSDVGKLFQKVVQSDKYYYYWQNQPSRLKREYKKVPVDDKQTEYWFDHGTCQWALIVDNTTNYVSAWRYVKKTEDCAYKYFYEGAW